MFVAAYYATKLVLELDMDATVPRDDDMLEVDGAEDGVEKEGVANKEDDSLHDSSQMTEEDEVISDYDSCVFFED